MKWPLPHRRLTYWSSVSVCLSVPGVAYWYWCGLSVHLSVCLLQVAVWVGPYVQSTTRNWVCVSRWTTSLLWSLCLSQLWRIDTDVDHLSVCLSQVAVWDSPHVQSTTRITFVFHACWCPHRSVYDDIIEWSKSAHQRATGLGHNAALQPTVVCSSSSCSSCCCSCSCCINVPLGWVTTQLYNQQLYVAAAAVVVVVVVVVVASTCHWAGSQRSSTTNSCM